MAVHEDEFTAACDEAFITQAEASAARRAIGQIALLVRDGAEPFASVGARRLHAAKALGLRPVRYVP